MPSRYLDPQNHTFPHRYARCHFVRAGKDVYQRDKLDLLNEEIMNALVTDRGVQHDYQYWIPGAEGKVERQANPDVYNVQLGARDTWLC